ncbi:MAG TPA: hypothetical protein VFP43_13200 [Mesorhizobium sp.]|nr:hypothetical protein [Mesorhizobium sp.]
MLVFDASGSMTGMGFGENTVTRIQQVRRALATVLPSVAPVRNLGLVVSIRRCSKLPSGFRS